MTYQFHHLHLICSDLEKTINFFSEVLGAKFVTRRKFGAAEGATFDFNGTGIYLRAAREDDKITGDSTRTHYGYSHIGLKVENLEEAFAELTKKGFIFTQPPRVSGTRKMAFFNGPDNISIELVQDIN